MRSIAMSVSVCLSARISKRPHGQTSRNFVYVLIVAVARFSSDNSAICYVPVLRMASRLSIIGQVKATPVRHILKVGVSPGAKSDVYDCLVLIDMVRFASYGVEVSRRADVFHLYQGNVASQISGNLWCLYAIEW